MRRLHTKAPHAKSSPLKARLLADDRGFDVSAGLPQLQELQSQQQQYGAQQQNHQNDEDQQ